MSFMLTSEISKQYLLEEDAIKGFRMAVENGQSRLALQILTDIVDFFMDVISVAIEDGEETEENPVEKTIETKTEEVAHKQKETSVEEKDSTPKTSVKKETKTAEEK